MEMDISASGIADSWLPRCHVKLEPAHVSAINMRIRIHTTLPPIDMETDRGSLKRNMIFQDPPSGSKLIGGRVITV